MPQLLELAHLVDEHRVADVQIRGRRVESGLDDQRPALLELRLEPVLGQHFIRAAGQFRDLFLDTAHVPLCVVPATTRNAANCSIVGRF